MNTVQGSMESIITEIREKVIGQKLTQIIQDSTGFTLFFDHKNAVKISCPWGVLETTIYSV